MSVCFFIIVMAFKSTKKVLEGFGWGQCVDVFQQHALEIETAVAYKSTKEFLEGLGLGQCVDVFQQHALEIETLKNLTDLEIKETLVELKLPLGNRLKISKRLHEMKGNNTS